MARMTKTQRKRALIAIKTKARKLWDWKTGQQSGEEMSTKDMMAIEAIITKNLKKIR